MTIHDDWVGGSRARAARTKGCARVARRWSGLAVLALACDAWGLSRAMWAEFNTLYLINLRPVAECNQYKSRSLALLQDKSLAPEEVDTRMHALWREAKVACLNKAAPTTAAAEPAAGIGTVAATGAAVSAAAAPADIAPKAPSAKPPVGSPPANGLRAGVPALAATSAESRPKDEPPVAAQSAEPPPQSPPPVAPVAIAPPMEARARAAADVGSNRRPNALARPQFKPIIERPSTEDLRLQAACAERNPYAYQTTADDPCVKLATKKSPEAGSAAGAPQGGAPWWVWACLGLLVTTGAGAGGWFGYRAWGRRRLGQAVEAATAEDTAGNEGLADPLAAAAR